MPESERVNSSSGNDKFRVLLTGASGSLGSHLLDNLAPHKDQLDLISLGRTRPSRLSAIEHHIVDLAETDALQRTLGDLERVDAIVHLGALVHTRSAPPEQWYKANVLATSILVDFLHPRKGSQNTVPAFIHASTIGVYPRAILSSEYPANEDVTPGPETVYARSKAESETVVNRICRKNGINPYILRISPSISRTDRGNLNVLRRMIRRYHMIPVCNPSRVFKSFVHANDVAEVIRRIIFTRKHIPGTYNLAGPPISLGGILDCIQHSERTFWRIPTPRPVMKWFAPQMIENTVVDASKAERAFGIRFADFCHAYCQEWNTV